MKSGPKRIPPEIRLQRFVTRGHPDECWPWQGSTSYGGYGQIGVGRESPLRAHRVAWVAEYGPIPDDLHVLHKCDNPPCCNPNHLFLGTKSDNAIDAVRKRRLPTIFQKGEAHVRAKLTDDQVTEIRERYKSAGVTYQSLADEFGVNPGTIGSIVRRKHRV